MLFGDISPADGRGERNAASDTRARAVLCVGSAELSAARSAALPGDVSALGAGGLDKMFNYF